MLKRILFPLFTLALVVGHAAPVAALPPDPVTPLSASATGTTITATWGAAVGAVDYEVTLSGPTPGGAITTETSISFDNVLAGDYVVGVDARNADGSSGFVTQTVTVDAVAPSAPQGVSASVSGQSVAVSWSVPASNGGDAGITYFVSGNGSSGSTSGTSFTLNNVAPGTFTVSVTATNSGGTSPAGTSNQVTVDPPVSAPSAPQGVSASVSGQSVAVSWSVPASNGGDAGITYNVSGNGSSGSTSGTELTLSNVAPGTFTVSVTATNSGGTSPAGTSNQVTVNPPVSAPSAPQNVVATALAGQAVLVSWSVPADVGGDAGITYNVSGNGSSGSTAGTSLTLTNVAPGTFTVSVTATNSGGTSPAGTSNQVTVTPPVTLPGAPGDVQASVSGQTITASWSTPNDGGDPNLTYTVRLSNGAQQSGVTGNSTQFTGVAAGSYTVSVSATNTAGTGPTGTSSSVSVFSLPSVPRSLEAAADGAAVVATWLAPASSGNQTITGYAVRLELNGSEVASQTVTATGARFEGQAPGVYTVVVSAINATGTGPGAAVQAEVGSLAPSAPTDVQASADFQTITITWDPPLVSGNTSLSGYRVELGELTRSVSAGTRSAVFANVPVGVYTAEVRAINAAGAGLPGLSEQVTSKTKFSPFLTADDLLTQQYADFLGRPPDAPGLAYWRGILGPDRSGAPKVIQEFMLSPEFRPRRAIARLYLAFFDRAPDRAGFDYWAGRVRRGAKLNNIAAEFAKSEEFQNTYGNLNDAQFIALVYNNVLLRSPDIDGFVFWVERMKRPGVTRGDLMVAFSESLEFIRNSTPAVDVIMTYRGMLDRAPDPAGFAFWVGEVAGARGDSLQALIRNFLVSVEYSNRVD